MNWRAPWLTPRLKLMGFAAWDTAILIVLYNAVGLVRLRSFLGFGPGLIMIVTIWITSSYLIGRYSLSIKNSKLGLAGDLGQSLIPGCCVLLAFSLHSWAYQVVDEGTRMRGFLLPVICLSVFLSGYILRSISRRNEKEMEWVIICTADEKRVLKQEISIGCNRMLNIRFFTGIDDLKDVTRIEAINNGGIVLGSLGPSWRTLESDILEFKKAGTDIIPLIDWCELYLQRIPPEFISRRWLVHADGFKLKPNSLSWRIKRFGDICGALLLILLTSPLLALFGLAIWLEDGGPVFYGQSRTGLYGECFKVWKLRSMSCNAEVEKPLWAQKADSRITRVGKVMRAIRVDELPQLVGVIRGELSLIGPRPERPEIEKDLEQHVPHYRIRHWIRPGLSGWAQVSYPYGASIADSRMKLSYDLYYLRNAGLFFDILITLKTIRIVLNAEGASPRAQ